MNSLSRCNILRILAGLGVRASKYFLNHIRINGLRLMGLQCSTTSYISPRSKLSHVGNITIGSHCVIAECTLYALEKITIGDRSIIGENVYLCTGSHDIWASDFKLITQPIQIGSDVWVATGATVLPGVTIGDGAVIGAMAVVSRNVPAGAVVVGNPGRIVKTGRSVPDEFNPLTLASIDIETSIERLSHKVKYVKTIGKLN